jgi:hypothetical protein
MMAITEPIGSRAAGPREGKESIVELIGSHAVGLREGMMPIAAGTGSRAVGLAERMNSPQQTHEVHLRGLGGLTPCGVSGRYASATGSFGLHLGQP